MANSVTDLSRQFGHAVSDILGIRCLFCPFIQKKGEGKLSTKASLCVNRRMPKASIVSAAVAMNRDSLLVLENVTDFVAQEVNHHKL